MKIIKKINIKFYLFFLVITTYAIASTNSPLDNIQILKNPKTYKEIPFIDFEGNEINLKEEKSKVFILNFWATWCKPCIDEMPSLDKLHAMNHIRVFPINIEKKNLKKTDKFFKELNIKNLSIYFDTNNKLVKLFNLRGVPTTIILNENKDEIARIIGSGNFTDKKFIEWLNEFQNK